MVWVNGRRIGRGGGNRTRMPELMGLPRSPSLPSAANLVDPEGIEPSSRGCRPRILPLNDEPILAGRTGFEPVALFADNEAATLAAPRPLGMVPAVGLEPTSAPAVSRRIEPCLRRPRKPYPPRWDGRLAGIRTPICTV